MPSAVESVTGENLDDAALRSLGKYKKVRWLQLGVWAQRDVKNSRMSDRGFKALAPLKLLETLNLRGAKRLTSEALQYLSHFRKLRELNLVQCRGVDDKTLKAIGRLKGLHTLHLGGYDDEDHPYMPIPSYRPIFTSEGFLHLKKLKLRDLSLCYSPLTVENMEVLGKMTSLRILHIGWNNLTDEHIEPLVKIKKLRKLNMSGVKGFTASAFGKLAAFKHLEELVLEMCKSFDDECAAHLPQFKKLKKLNIMGTAIGEKGFEEIAKLKGVQKLKLYHNNVTGRTLEALSKMKRLKELSMIEANTLTDEGFKILKTFPQLETLELWGCSGLTAGCLKTLKSLKGLKRLILSSVGGVSSSDKAWIQKSLPGCEISFY